MSKTIFILPSTIADAPYLNYYLDTIDGEKIIISWDRFKKNSVKYHNAHVINYYDISKNKKINYIGFLLFTIRQLIKFKDSKIISFTLQNSILLIPILTNFFRKKYVLDIRDPSKVTNFKKAISLLIKSSYATAISSEGYLEWLDKNRKHSNIIISNNLHPQIINTHRSIKVKPLPNKNIKISNIGFIRHYEKNVKLINDFSNDRLYDIEFHGAGNATEKLKRYVERNKIRNVKITGRYEKNNEKLLYLKSNIINIIIDDNKEYSKNSMANRFLNGVLNGKILLTNSGTYMADLSHKFKLGPVVTDDSIKANIENYINNYNYTEHERLLNKYWNEIKEQNNRFIEMITKFSK